MAERKQTTRKTTAKVTPSRGRKKTIFPETPGERHESKESSSIFPEFLRFGESYSSLVLGIIVVIAVATLLVTFARNSFQHHPKQDTSSTSTKATQETNVAAPGSIYTVQEGDDLWKIAEKAYSDGNEWQIIARANDITDPAELSVGTKLQIPESENQVHLTVRMTPVPSATASPTLVVTATPTQVVTPTLQPTVAHTITPTAVSSPKPTIANNQQPTGPPSALSGKSYTVVAGDTLWDISVRAYGNGYRWVEIAQANHWGNPDLIHPGDKFQLPK